MEIVAQMVEFAGNGSPAPGYLAQPGSGGPFPAVVVIQEWWGLNENIKDIARRFAAEGFAALAPDLYRGQVVSEPDDARKLAMELDRPSALKDIQGAVNYLIAQPFVSPRQVGVVGFCMGGGLPAMMSYSGQNVGAVVVFYGGSNVVWDDESVRRISAPLLGLYGEADQGQPVDKVRANEAKLKAHGKTHEFVIYPEAPHAFFNDERPAYREQASADAWRRTLGWFRQFLKT